MDLLQVTCAVIFFNGKVLAALRPMQKPAGGYWEFPGGKTEPGESAHAAIQREIKEELAIEVKVVHALTPVLKANPAGQDICLLPFVCIWENGEIELLAHDEIRWLDRTDLFELGWAPADRAIAGELLYKWNLIEEKSLIY